ncbi:MAG: polyamine aminopropyltransferase [Burkholderiaceae bacterium]|nr:polyamine aminopropyltransferase [Burkholderiaceae bacterium]
MDGLHLTADCFECRCNHTLLLDEHALSGLMHQAARSAGLNAVGERFHAFKHTDGSPAGVTGTVLLAESHIAVHTWPERSAVTLDVYVCNFNQDNSVKARALADQLISTFQATRVVRNEIKRGDPNQSAQQSQPEPALQLIAQEQLTEFSSTSTKIEQRIVDVMSPFQHIEIAETKDLGRIMRLDGATMTSEKDEFFYHECLIHPAAITHQNPQKVLIIGGGDGGACEELLKHNTIEQITICEIDEQVVAKAKEFLETIHHGALTHPKVNIVHADGFAFVRDCLARFDLIFLDLTDPIAPNGSALAQSCLTEEFFQACKNCLTKHGQLVLHLGSPFYHAQRYQTTYRQLQTQFDLIRPYHVYIPSYGAEWGMAIASNETADSASNDPLALTASTVKQRIEHRGLHHLKYYNHAIHQALFALPNYVHSLIDFNERKKL